MPADLTQTSFEAVNERLYRLEHEVDEVKKDVNDQRVSIARITEQVASHEKRGEERHVQLMSAIQEMKQDYRAVFSQQAEESKAQIQAQIQAGQNQTKIIMAVIGAIATIVGAIYGLSPSQVAKMPATIPDVAPTAPTKTDP